MKKGGDKFWGGVKFRDNTVFLLASLMRDQRLWLLNKAGFMASGAPEWQKDSLTSQRMDLWMDQ